MKFAADFLGKQPQLPDFCRAYKSCLLFAERDYERRCDVEPTQLDTSYLQSLSLRKM